MTEDEAKTKWCPFVRTGLLVGNGGVAVNQSVADKDPDAPYAVIAQTRCIASDCMAWRSGINKYRDHNRGVDVEAPYGYCGLAGKP